MCWIAVLIINVVHFGSDKPSGRNLYHKPPYGLYLPCVNNAMPRYSFEFLRQYIQFTDNDQRVPAGEPGHNPLNKISWAMDVMMKGCRKAWVAGKAVTIDESMIKYCGKMVSWVQYMPAKPIKHGIKVFALCCSLSAV